MNIVRRDQFMGWQVKRAAKSISAILIIPELSEKVNPSIDEYKILSKRLNALHKNWRFDN